MRLAIVVAAFNRPQALRRLLDSLRRLEIPEGAGPSLVFCVDRADDPMARSAVDELVRGFEWRWGPKTIVAHPRHLGLRENILRCGDVALHFDGAVVLEDDLVVSPHLYRYCEAAYAAYAEDERLASFSLYRFPIAEFARRPFVPVDDGYDAYFIQTCSSCGQMWTNRQWARFREWFERHRSEPVTVDDGVPEAITRWPDSSWKKSFNKYMVHQDLYSCAPRISLTTNFGDDGTHHRFAPEMFQTPLLCGPKSWRLPRFEDSRAVYDGHFEPVLERCVAAGTLASIPCAQIECDLFGLKDAARCTRPWMLTSRRPRAPVAARFGLRMKPALLNAICGVEGEDIVLVRTDDLPPGPPSRTSLPADIDWMFPRRRALVWLGLRGMLARATRRLGRLMRGSDAR